MRNVIFEESIEYIDKIVNNDDKIVYNSAELKKHWDRVKRFTTTAAAYAESIKKEKRTGMIIQLSSELGPFECRVAVGGIYRALKKEFPDIEFISGVQGEVPGSYSSIIFYTEFDLSELEGTIQWICKSEQRVGHKTKNWFINCSILVDGLNSNIESRNTNKAWNNHTSLVRGNPVRVYEGSDFELKNK